MNVNNNLVKKIKKKYNNFDSNDGNVDIADTAEQ